MRWRWWQTADDMATKYAADREPDTDDHFIAECNLPCTADAERVALAVRRSVASYGMIEEQYIQASDRYPDELENLSGWDSLDFLDWMLELERELGIPIPEEAFADIGQPFTFKVKDLAHAVHAYIRTTSYGRRRESPPT